MSTDKKKRERSANYTEYEREVFIEIIQKFKSVVENVKTDGATIEKKNRAWSDIENQFNSADSQIRPRSAQQLKRLYENMKRTSKKICPTNKLLKNNQRLSNSKPKDNHIDYRFLEVVCDHIEPPKNVYDCDDNYHDAISETEADNTDDTIMDSVIMNTQSEIIHKNIVQEQNSNEDGEHAYPLIINVNNNSSESVHQSPNSRADDYDTNNITDSSRETNQSRGEELRIPVGISDVQNIEHPNEPVENTIIDSNSKKRQKISSVTRTTERIQGLCEARPVGPIQNESSYMINVYKLQCELLTIKKQNAILKQLYLKKKNKLIDQKLLKNEIDFDH